MKRIAKIIEDLGFQNKSVKDELIKLIEFKSYKAGEKICEFDNIPKYIYYLGKGFVRVYSLSDKGKEYNKAFTVPNEFMASFTSLIRKEPSDSVLECLTDCEVFTFDYFKIIELEEKYPEIYKVHIKVLEYFFIKNEYENTLMATKDAKERYIDLISRLPLIENNISQYHIASYLGITPVQLSRIRSSL